MAFRRGPWDRALRGIGGQVEVFERAPGVITSRAAENGGADPGAAAASAARSTGSAV